MSERDPMTQPDGATLRRLPSGLEILRRVKHEAIDITEVVGLVDGMPTHTIRIVCDGRYVHAYPVQDRP